MFDYLKRGVAAGGVAGVAYGLYMAFVVNPLTEYLDHLHHDHGHHTAEAAEATATVSEPVATVASLGGGLLWAVFLGGCFGLALFVFEPAVPGPGAVKPSVLAGAGFLTVSVTPWLGVPPAAPGAEQLFSVDTRLAVYGSLVGLGALVSALAFTLYRRTAPRHRLLAVAAGAVPVVATVVVVPVVTPQLASHAGLSADLVVAYRAAVVAGQAGIWLLIVVSFGWLQRRGSPAVPRAAEPSSPESA